MVEKQIQETRALLDELVSNCDAKLCEGKMLEVSKRLDGLISIYYEKNSK